jgi:hypothetical protein
MMKSTARCQWCGREIAHLWGLWHDARCEPARPLAAVGLAAHAAVIPETSPRDHANRWQRKVWVKRFPPRA